MQSSPSSAPHLFSPIRLRDVTARNRLWIAPMCMYSVFAEDGIPTDWHRVHYGSRAVGGAGLVIIEATAVEARGRISARDLGIWNDKQGQAFTPIVEFMVEYGAVPAIQLAHAGRKAEVPGNIGPSALAFSERYATPQEMSVEDIEDVVNAFAAGAERARQSGFQAVEIHSAHGYLLHEFLSPLSNHRTDQYGGSLDNRMRFPLQVVRAIRNVWPEHLPLITRISATDWAEGGWDVDQSVLFSQRMREAGVDLVDVSSGGLTQNARMSIGPGYQVPLAARIRSEAEIPTGAVGLITEAKQANDIVAKEEADVVLIARQSLRDAYWPLRVAQELGAEAPVPTQYERGWG
jgi:2,4-dienoyl-CoA reductase-like NADH-dependent reductase (Old Yellow Enzyme family)